jgi:predicted NAD-dependent protein-ADP-ribosyltransferase YbiA (DUF1768 family)
MVVSKLDPTINYIENRKLNKEDKELSVTPFIMYYDDVAILCAIGREKYTYVSKNIMYMPLYLIHSNKVIMQIGLFEILASELPNILDEDTEIDVELLDDPLFYSFINKGMIEKYKYEDTSDDEDEEQSDASDDDEEQSDASDDDDDEEQSDASDTEDEDKSDSDEEDGTEKPASPEQSSFAEDAIIKELFDEDNETYDENETYSKHKEILIDFKKGVNWIQQYFKNPNYTIIDNEGGGDCLFAVIRDAYKSIGKDISVYQLRSILAKEANEDIFNGYKMMYDMFSEEASKIKKNISVIVREHNKLKKNLKTEKNITKKKLIVNESKKLVSKHRQMKEEYMRTSELLNEYRFMEGVDSLEKFKEIIKTCKFWGETWAISTLERALNVKLIILSSEAYNTGDYENVIMCGQLNDEILREKGEFKPKYYIMTEWLGYHYKTIAYKDEKILTYDKIPYGIREKIVEKCLERGEGPFGIIPKFNMLKQRIETRVRESLGSSSTSSGTSDDGDSVAFSESSVEKISKGKTPETSHEKQLYNPNTIFQFYERSAHRKPGKGSGEKMTLDGEKEYVELAKFEDWRRKLSNGYEREFEINDLRWNSVEHYYQAQKFNENKEMYNKFALNSGSDISKSFDLAKTAGSSKPVKNGILLRDRSIKPRILDDDEGKKIISHALQAKFKQNEDLKRILLATKDAGLFVFIRGIPPKEYTLLMELRDELK